MFGIAIELVEWLYSYSNLDASTGEYPEEEGCYQEEEENFENYQGKLIFLQSAKLYQSKSHWPITFCPMILSKVFTLQALFTFVLSKYFLNYDSLG